MSLAAENKSLQVLDDLGRVILKQYLESVHHFPKELADKLKELGDMDEQYQKYMEKVESMLRTQNIDPRRFSSLKDKANALVDRKLSLSVEIYDAIEQHVQRLDEELKSYEPDIRDEFSQFPSHDQPISSHFIAERQSLGVFPGDHDFWDIASTEMQSEAVDKSFNEDEEIDPDEPKYCTCKKVSHGEMIACDNDDCEVEWFHFECVGLQAKPKGRWICPSCMQMSV